MQEVESSDGKMKYWRSIDRLERTKAYISSIEDEFRDGDSEVTGLQRREMLKLMGASLALAGVGTACRRPVETIVPYTRSQDNIMPGIPNFFATARPSPWGASGLLVESHEGRPTKVEGNPDHALNQGTATIHDQASVLEMYDPDRSRLIMQRGADGRLPATWSDWDTFANEHFEKYRKTGGEGLAIVTNGQDAPSFLRLLNDVKTQMPKAQVFNFDPLTPYNALSAAEMAFGPGARVLYDLEPAQVIVTVHADPLMWGPECLKHARGFAHGRKIYAASQAAGMNRLYCVEADYSVTGTNADHRLRLPAHLGGAFLVALAKQLTQLGLVFPEPLKQLPGAKGDVDGAFVKALARDMMKHPGASVVMVGESHDPAVQALGLAINVALGALGKCMRVLQAPEPLQPQGYGALKAFADQIAAKRVKTALLLDVNLAYSTPGAFNWSQQLKEIDTVVHAGLYDDETAQLATWHLPMSHFLESWGDARAFDGTASIVQPLIAPLFDTRSSLEILSQTLNAAPATSFEMVQQTWRKGSFASDKAFRKIVHDGIVPDTSFNARGSSLNASLIAEGMRRLPTVQTGTNSLELVLSFSRSVLDGRFANLGWLQELPDPVTKLTWDNALLVSAELARQLKLESRVKDRYYLSDVVTLKVGDQSIEVPTFVLPGLPDHTVVLQLGYGRAACGTVGTGVGVNAYALQPLSGNMLLSGAQIERVGRTVELATTQEQFAMNADTVQETPVLSLRKRDPAKVSDVAGYQHDPNYVKAEIPESSLHHEAGSAHPVPKQMTSPWPYKGNKWGMVIDLTSCIGCNACVTACQSENNIPVVGKDQVKRSRAMHWIRVDRYFTGDVANPKSISQPVPCMHCENAPCEPVCPVAATTHDHEGLNVMAYNRCIGTRYCGNNCPYKVRRFNFLDYSHSGNLYVNPVDRKRSETLQMQSNPDVTIRYRGVMEKCTYCTQRIQEAKMKAIRNNEDQNALKDASVTPACAQTCPTQAITFGNLNDPDSRVNQLKNSDRNYDLLSELNVRPRTSYLGKLRNPNPELV